VTLWLANVTNHNVTQVFSNLLLMALSCFAAYYWSTAYGQTVKRQKQHFHHLEQYGIDLIIGCNGLIWVGEHVEVRDDMVEDPLNQYNQQVLNPNENSSSLEEQDKNYTALETRKYICRVANAVRVLSTSGFTITLEIIKRVVDLSLSANLSIHDMLGSEFCVLVAEKEAERRSSNKRKR